MFPAIDLSLLEGEEDDEEEEEEEEEVKIEASKGIGSTISLKVCHRLIPLMSSVPIPSLPLSSVLPLPHPKLRPR